MGVQLKEILKLPSLNGAEVVAGKRALEREVLALSFLEADSVNEIKHKLFRADEYLFGELDITSFYSVKDDLGRQIEIINNMHDLGAVGLIVYYVGVFLPYLDDRVLQVADEKDFAIIQMPQKNTQIRFSEAIYEISQLLLEHPDANFATEIKRKLSEFPRWSQTMETTLKMLADVTKANVAIVSDEGEVEYATRWPRNSKLDFAQITKGNVQDDQINYLKIKLDSQGEASNYWLWLIKERGVLSKSQLLQAKNVVESSLFVWGKSTLYATKYSLISGILNNEADRMWRLAQNLDVDLDKLSVMWIVSTYTLDQIQDIITHLNNYLHKFYQEVLVDYLDNYIVVLCGDCQSKKTEMDICRDFLESSYSKQNIDAIIYSPNTKSIDNFGRNYRLVMTHKLALRKVFPTTRFFSMIKCEYINNIEIGWERNSSEITTLESSISKLRENQELMHTLCVYLLDSQRDIQKASELLFVHRNTVKYRLKQISKLLECDLSVYDESLVYYLACIIYRLKQ